MSISKIKVGSTEHDLHASKLTTARTITLSGDVSGSTTFDGSGNVTITTTVADDSHNHIISNVDGLQTALDKKVPKRTSDGTSYTGLGTYYANGNTAKYVKISFPSVPTWTMVTMELTIRESYANKYSGKLIIYANQSSNQNWNISAVAYGTLTTAIKVYGSDKQHIYISGIAAWGGLSLDRMLIGDAATSSDLTGMTLTSVDSLPETYQTATMYYGIHSGNIGSQAVHYATSAGSATTATKATQDGNGNVIESTYAKKNHTHSVTAAGTNSSTSITPSGTVSQPTFTGTAASHNHTFTGTAAEHNHTFTGTQATASVKYTPAGTVSSSFTGTAHNHTFSGTPATSEKPDTTNVTTIYSITGVGTLPSASLSSGTLPSCSYTAPSHSYTAPSLTGSVSNQCLTLTFNAGSHSFNAGSHSFSAGAFPKLTFSAGSLPTREAVSVPDTNHTHSVTATGTIGNATAGGSVSSTFAGTEATISHTFTPSGSISKTSITPAGTISSKELTPAGTVSKPTFTGTAASHTHTFTGSAVNSATES